MTPSLLRSNFKWIPYRAAANKTCRMPSIKLHIRRSNLNPCRLTLAPHAPCAHKSRTRGGTECPLPRPPYRVSQRSQGCGVLALSSESMLRHCPDKRNKVRGGGPWTIISPYVFIVPWLPQPHAFGSLCTVNCRARCTWVVKVRTYWANPCPASSRYPSKVEVPDESSSTDTRRRARGSWKERCFASFDNTPPSKGLTLEDRARSGLTRMRHPFSFSFFFFFSFSHCAQASSPPHNPSYYSIGHTTWHTRLNTTSCPPSHLGHLLFLQSVELASPTASLTSPTQALGYSARHRHRYHNLGSTLTRLPTVCLILANSTLTPPTIQQNTNISQDVRLHSTGILVRPLPLDRVQVVQRLHHHPQALPTQRHPL